MAAHFVTPDQERTYGHFAGELTEDQLARFFHFDEADHSVIAVRRSWRARLGFALQLGTVRFLGTFLSEPSQVPRGVLEYTAHQLGISQPHRTLSGYGTGQTRWAHIREIRERFGYREFQNPLVHFRFLRWLYARAWISAERPSVLFDLSIARLVESKILLPGISTLARLVGRVRDRAAVRLWSILSRLPSPEQRQRLEALVEVSGSHLSDLDRLRRSPTNLSARGLLNALRRLEEVRAIGVGDLDLSTIPSSRFAALARYATAARAQTVERLQPKRRVATLLAFASVLEVQATDDVIDLFDQLVGQLLSRAKRTNQTERLRTLKRLDRAALDLSIAVEFLLDSPHRDLKSLQATLFDRLSAERLQQAVGEVRELTQASDGRHYEDLLKRYRTVRQFLPSFLETIPLETLQGSSPLLNAVAAWSKLEGRRRVLADEVPLEGIPPAWRRLTLRKDGTIDRRAYTLYLTEQIRERFRRRDLFVRGSRRWGDPRNLLLDDEAWASNRARVSRSLGHDPSPEATIASLRRELHEAYCQTAARLPENTAVRFEDQGAKSRLVLSRLEAVEETESLLALRTAVAGRLPAVDLPDVLLEVDVWTGFTQEFTHASQARSRVKELPTSVCAVLIAEACNLGFEPVASAESSALSPDRLSWIEQNYMRSDTLRAANARLVEHQTTIPLVQHWGGGEVASADGLRFVVPVRSLHAGPNPKYFGPGRGVTYYNFMSDQYTGFHGIVIPGTLRDSTFILDGLLEHDTSLRPLEIMTDSAAYSDLVFGLFRLLGYQFSPRLADVGSARFWRMESQPDYGPFDQLARHRINTQRIAAHWDDLLRVGGSLLLGTSSASQLIRALQAGGRPTALGRAIAEYGRIPKTLHLLRFIDIEAYRRRVLTQINRSEERHQLSRSLFHGKRGELRQPYREGQEDQLGALGLVLNAIVLWNTVYMNAAVESLQRDGFPVDPADLHHLSPLRYEHINLHGRYHFGLPEEVQNGNLRDLRVPSGHR